MALGSVGEGFGLKLAILDSFSGPLRRYGTQVTTAKVQTTSLSAAVTANAQAFRTMGLAMTVAGGAILAGLGLAIHTSGKFQQSMANVAAVAGATGKQFDELSEFARKMGADTVFSATQAADAMYYLASAGYGVEKMMAALPGTLNLAAATQAELAETTSIVVATLNQFGLGAAQATRVANTFSAVIGASQATIDRIGESMAYVGPVFAGLNYTLEETSAALGVLYNAGFRASMVGTALRNAVGRLLSPTKDVVEVLAELNLTIEDVSPTTNKFAEIIRVLNERGISTEQTMRMFGLRAGPAMSSALKTGATAMEDLIEKITGTNKAAEMAAKQISTWQGTLKLLKSAIEEVQLILGDTLLPILTPLVSRFKDIVRVIGEWMKANPEFTSQLIKFAAVVGGLMVVGGPLMMLAPTLANISTMAVSAGGLVATTLALMLNPISLLALGILVLWLAWEKNWGDIQGKTEAVYKAIAETLNWEKFKEKVAAVWEKTKELVNVIGKVAISGYEWARDNIADLTGWIREHSPEIFGKILYLAGFIGGVFFQGYQFIKEKMVLLGDWLKENLPKFPEKLVELGGFVAGVFISAYQFIKEKMVSLGDWLPKNLPELKEKIVEIGGIIGGVFISAYQFIKEKMVLLGDWLKENLPELPGNIFEIGSIIGGVFVSAWKFITEKMADVWQSLKNWWATNDKGKKTIEDKILETKAFSLIDEWVIKVQNIIAEIPEWAKWVLNWGPDIFLAGMFGANIAKRIGVTKIPLVKLAFNVLLVVETFKWSYKIGEWLGKLDVIKKPIQDKFMEIFELHPELLDMDLVESFAKTIGLLFVDGLGKIVKESVDFYSWLWWGYVGEINKIYSLGWDMAKEIVGGIIDFFKNIPSLWSELWKGIVTGKGLEPLKKKISEIFAPVRRGFEAGVNWELFSGAGKETQNVIDNMDIVRQKAEEVYGQALPDNIEQLTVALIASESSFDTHAKAVDRLNNEYKGLGQLGKEAVAEVEKMGFTVTNINDPFQNTVATMLYFNKLIENNKDNLAEAILRYKGWGNELSSVGGDMKKFFEKFSNAKEHLNIFLKRFEMFGYDVKELSSRLGEETGLAFYYGSSPGGFLKGLVKGKKEVQKAVISAIFSNDMKEAMALTGFKLGEILMRKRSPTGVEGGIEASSKYVNSAMQDTTVRMLEYMKGLSEKTKKIMEPIGKVLKSVAEGLIMVIKKIKPELGEEMEAILEELTGLISGLDQSFKVFELSEIAKDILEPFRAPIEGLDASYAELFAAMNSIHNKLFQIQEEADNKQLKEISGFLGDVFGLHNISTAKILMLMENLTEDELALFNKLLEEWAITMTAQEEIAKNVSASIANSWTIAFDRLFHGLLGGTSEAYNEMKELEESYISDLVDALDEYMDYRKLRNMGQAELETALESQLSILRAENIRKMSERELRHHDEQIRNLESLRDQFGEAMDQLKNETSIFGNFFTQLWKGIADAAIAEIARIIVKTQFMQSIITGIGGLFSGLFSFLTFGEGGIVKKFAQGGILPMQSGGITPSIDLRREGVVSSPTILPMAGDEGPEAFVPLRSGRIPVELGGTTRPITVGDISVSMNIKVANLEDLKRMDRTNFEETLARSIKAGVERGVYQGITKVSI